MQTKLTQHLLRADSELREAIILLLDDTASAALLGYLRSALVLLDKSRKEAERDDPH